MLFVKIITSSSSGSTANGSQYELVRAASMCRGKPVRHGRVSAACLKMPYDRLDLSAKDPIRYNHSLLRMRHRPVA